MRKVAILGIGQTKVDEHWEKSLREVGGDAAFAAMQDAGVEKVDALFVGNMLAPIVNGQNQLGTFFAETGSGQNRSRLRIGSGSISRRADGRRLRRGRLRAGDRR